MQTILSKPIALVVGFFFGGGVALAADGGGFVAPRDVFRAFEKWISADVAERPDLADAPFAHVPLGKTDASRVRRLLWEDHVRRVRADRSEEIESREITIGDKTMRFEMETYGSKPKDGRALFISMHGGGGTTAAANESQWKNQVRLGDKYKPKGCIYLAPRAPTDAWNLWHKGHIDQFFDRLIEDLIAVESIDPNRVFLMGYSAGGDGVYQLAPRMADRLAGACMMAGHPNEAQPFGLRNIAFTIDMGENDGAYNRNTVAASWGAALGELRDADPGAYVHKVNIRKGKGHWMNLEDKASVKWISKFTRNPFPDKVVWFQDDVTHDRFYWLALPPGGARKGQHIVATLEGQSVTIEKADGVTDLVVRLNDTMADLDQPIEVLAPNGKTLFEGVLPRTLATLSKTLSERGDPRSVFSAEIEVPVPAGS